MHKFSYGLCAGVIVTSYYWVFKYDYLPPAGWLSLLLIATTIFNLALFYPEPEKSE